MVAPGNRASQEQRLSLGLSFGQLIDSSSVLLSKGVSQNGVRLAEIPFGAGAQGGTTAVACPGVPWKRTRGTPGQISTLYNFNIQSATALPISFGESS
jgi:hypothetical protein